MSSDMLKVLLYVFQQSDKCLIAAYPDKVQVGGIRDVGRNSVLRVCQSSQSTCICLGFQTNMPVPTAELMPVYCKN